MKSRSRKRREAHAIGKDEMNLLEYCIFSANDRVDRKTKSLVFEDAYAGRQRKLTVAFSAEYGRPTVRDDQVLVALLKLTRDQGFQSATVNFTRYEVLSVLDWPQTGHYYRQIEHALDRIRGTTLNWENAYWDHRAKEWATRKFSIIDDVELLDRGRYERIRQVTDEKQPRSWFRWSDVMFDSFGAGYIKTLDLDAFRTIQGDVAKRLYRWLDKHFKNPKRKLPIELPLETLAVQKLGFRSTAPSHLQRMLKPAIDELERRGVIRAETSRFNRMHGNLMVCFQPPQSSVARRPESHHAQASQNSLVRKLVDRGVDRKTAARLATECSDEAQRQIELFDYRVQKGWKPRSSGGGYLKEAIERRFDGPLDFQTSEKRSAIRAASARKEQERRRKAQQLRDDADEGRLAHQARVQAVERWRHSMNARQWHDTEAKVLAGMGAREIACYRISEFERIRVLFAHIPPKPGQE